MVCMWRIIANFAFGQVSLGKRFGRMLNKEASEPGGAEAIVFLGGWGSLGRLIEHNPETI